MPPSPVSRTCGTRGKPVEVHSKSKSLRFLTSSMYLGIVFAGFEIWGGGDDLQIKQFCALVN
jgi:hypothetical protein